jgi:hypothetical protein
MSSASNSEFRQVNKNVPEFQGETIIPQSVSLLSVIFPEVTEKDSAMISGSS